MPIQKRHLAPDFGVGRQIRILEILHICLRFESAVRLELGHKLPLLDGHLIEKKGDNRGAVVLKFLRWAVADLESKYQVHVIALGR